MDTEKNIFTLIKETSKELTNLEYSFVDFATQFNDLETRIQTIKETMVNEEQFLISHDIPQLTNRPEDIFSTITLSLIDSISKLYDSYEASKSVCSPAFTAKLKSSLESYCMFGVKASSPSSYQLLNQVYHIFRVILPAQARVLQNNIQQHRATVLHNSMQNQISVRMATVTDLHSLTKYYDSLVDDETENYGNIIPITETTAQARERLLHFAAYIGEKLSIKSPVWKEAILRAKTAPLFKTMSQLDQAYGFWRLDNTFGETISNNFSELSFAFTSVSLYSAGSYALIQSELVEYMRAASDFSFNSAFTSLLSSVNAIRSCSSTYMCREYGKKVIPKVKLVICSKIMTDLDERLSDDQKVSLKMMIEGISEIFQSD